MNLHTLLLAGSIAATSYDVETTFRAFDRCPSCYERNPVLRPFADSRHQMYAVQAGMTAGASWASWELKKQKKWYWWAPMLGNIGVHVGAGISNAKK